MLIESHELLSPTGFTLPADGAVMIIGTAKAATTSLYAALVRHPEICGCAIKEPWYFSKWTWDGVHEPVDRYAALWPDYDAGVHRRYVEASTSYTHYPFDRHVPERIRDYGLNPRFIYVVRNPYDRIRSMINFYTFRRKEPTGPFTDVRYVASAMYALQLEHFERVFPDRDRYRVIDFDDLTKRTADVVRDTFDFLDVDSSVAVDLPRLNTTPTFSVVERKMMQAGLRSTLRRLVPSSMRRAVKGWIRRWSPMETVTATDAEREVIYDTLYDDMQVLRQRYGVDVGKWGF